MILYLSTFLADGSLVWEDGGGTPYVAFQKRDIPLEATKALGGHYFRQSPTKRAPTTYPRWGNLADSFYDLVSADNHSVVREHAGWTWDSKLVADTSFPTAYPDGKSPLSELFGVEYDAFGLWYEEAEAQLPHSHVIDPYHRVDVVKSDRHVQVFALDGTSLVNTKSPTVVFETGLTTRYYFNRDDVNDADKVLSKELTPLTTVCPYKGIANYHDVILPSGEKLENQVWTYVKPLLPASALTGLVSFYVPGPKFKLVVNGEVVA